MIRKLASLIVPNLVHDKDYYLNLYKKRDGVITRFAPSPTGFLHTGGLYMALVNYKIARDNGGIFYLRIEDTDTLREVSGSKELIEGMLRDFGIEFNNDEAYGPYRQSERKDIYDAFIYDLILKGKAYPDFSTKEELETIRKHQEENKERIGYYGKYATYRNLEVSKAIELIERGTPYVVRLKSEGDFNKTFIFKDMLRGDIELHENDLDIVIRKTDGLPTYHFAHAIDDTLMHTSIVIRGEEWLMSIPTHYELFKTLGFSAPKYMHLSSILKIDELGHKRKLSKRYDNEASIEYLLKEGYPKKAIIDYLLILANSKYEDNMRDDYKIDINNFSVNGSIFDSLKLDNLSKEYIYNLDFDTEIKEILEYASKYNNELFNHIISNVDYFKKILELKNIPTPRKDFSKYSEILSKVYFFYNDLFDNTSYEELDMDKDTLYKVIDNLKECDIDKPEDLWLLDLKEKASTLGFAKNKKEMEKIGAKYMFSDFMKVLRIAICKKNESPSLYEVIRLIGSVEYKNRLTKYCK